MSNNFWRRINYMFGLIPIAALFGLLVFVTGVEIKDFDLWLHLAMGKFITFNKFVPTTDMLSCTIQGMPWNNHEWLFQIILYKIFSVFGPEGLIHMQTIVVTGTMLLLLFLGYQKDRQLLTGFLLLLVFLVYQQRFTIRPDIYSMLFFTIYIFVLSLHIDKRWSAFILFFVQILWVNMHGFFFFGPLFVGIGLVSEWIKRHVPLPAEWNESGRLNDDEYSRMKKIFIFIILACLVNPQTFEGAWYPVATFFSLGGENKIFFKYIQELQLPVTWDTILVNNHFVYYKLLIFLSFLSFVFNRRKLDISALFFWLIFLVFSLKAARNVAFFSFAAYLVIITNTLSISFNSIIPLRFTEEKFQHLTGIVFKLILFLWIFNYAQGVVQYGYYDFDKYERKSEFGGISQKSYPNKGVDFLVENNIKGNFFNDFNSGAYLLGRAFPNIKVFIDGRTEVYGAQFFNEYRSIWEKGNSELFEKVEEKYQLTGAFLNSSKLHIPGKILRYFYESKKWIPVYFNYDAVIFLKDVPKNKEWIEKFELDLTQWKVPYLDVVRLGLEDVLPYHHYYRAHSLESMGLHDAAFAESQAALDINPNYAKPHELIGKFYAKNKEYMKAFYHFRTAAITLPRKKSIRHNLALAYSDLGKDEETVKEYQAIIHFWPSDPKGYFLLSKTLAEQKKDKEAFEVLEQAHQLRPNDVYDVLGIGDIFYEQGSYDYAKKSYTLALNANKDIERIKKKLDEVKNILLKK